jgi:phage/plasmid-associated DNA primase
MSQVFIDDHTRNIVWNILSNYVYGRKTDTINSTIFVGDGGTNSKSTLIKLFESVLGDYVCKLPIDLLTTELSLQFGLVQSMNKRVASFQTPSMTESINFNSLKQLSNTNRIYGRRLYCTPIEFTPIFNTILVCNNTTNVSNITMSELIKLSDYNIVEFKSKFVNNPDPENPYEFRKDKYLSDKMQNWSETFMSILLCNYC